MFGRLFGKHSQQHSNGCGDDSQQFSSRRDQSFREQQQQQQVFDMKSETTIISSSSSSSPSGENRSSQPIENIQRVPIVCRENENGDSLVCSVGGVADQQTIDDENLLKNKRNSSSSYVHDYYAPQVAVTPSFFAFLKAFGLHLIELLNQDIQRVASTNASSKNEKLATSPPIKDEYGGIIQDSTSPYLSKYADNVRKAQRDLTSLMDEDFSKEILTKMVKYFRCLSMATHQRNSSSQSGSSSEEVKDHGFKNLEKRRKKLAYELQTYFMGVLPLSQDPEKCRQIIYAWVQFISLVNDVILARIKEYRNHEPSTDSRTLFQEQIESIGRELDILGCTGRNKPELHLNFNDLKIRAYIDPQTTQRLLDKERSDLNTSYMNVLDRIKSEEEGTVVQTPGVLTGGQGNRTTLLIDPTKPIQASISQRFRDWSRSVRFRMFSKEKHFQWKNRYNPPDRVDIFARVIHDGKILNASVSPVLQSNQPNAGSLYNVDIVDDALVLQCQSGVTSPELRFVIASPNMDPIQGIFVCRIRCLMHFMQNVGALDQARIKPGSDFQTGTESFSLDGYSCKRCNSLIRGVVHMEGKRHEVRTNIIKITRIGLLICPHECRASTFFACDPPRVNSILDTRGNLEL